MSETKKPIAIQEARQVVITIAAIKQLVNRFWDDDAIYSQIFLESFCKTICKELGYSYPTYALGVISKDFKQHSDINEAKTEEEAGRKFAKEWIEGMEVRT